jgi:MFS family permease
MASLTVTMCVGVSNLVWLPAMGAVSDRLGRRPLLVLFSVLSLVTSYPALLWLVSAPSFARLLAVELWLSFLFGGYNGAMVPFLAEIMPEKVRASGFSIAFSGATAVFGGFTPAICTWLIHETGNRAVPGLWVSFAAAIGLAAVFLTRRMESGFARTT